MYPATPADAMAPVGAIHLVRAQRRAFDDPPDQAVNDADGARLTEYLSDLIRPRGLVLRDELVAEGAGRAYGAMAEAIILTTVPVHEPVDLLIMAMAVPDIHPGRATATYLSDVCPGDPMAFTVCDQGSAAAFTALRLAREYAVHRRSRRSLVLVVEQSTMHYEPAKPTVLPRRDVAVALLLEAGAPDAASVRHHTDVAPGDVESLLLTEIGLLAPRTVILGETLATYAERIGAAANAVHNAPAGQPSTGVWWALVDELAETQAAPVLVADYEPTLRYLCMAIFATGSRG